MTNVLCGIIRPRRWVFSSPRLARHTARSALARLFNAGINPFALLFPADCAVCGQPLTRMSLAPVCPDCLAPPPVFVAEHFCELCRTPFLNASPLDERGLCALCRSGVTAFQAAYSYGAYEGRLRTLIHLFKYRGMTPLAAPMSAWLARALPRDASFDAIVPMPLHWWRFLRRGFNQSALLAAGLSRITGLPAVRALARVRATAPQASFTHAARRANVRGAFRVRLPRFVPGRRLLLLDDVLTTGATVNEAAAALRRAGAASVAVLTLARVDRRQLHRVFELSAVDSLSRGPLP